MPEKFIPPNPDDLTGPHFVPHSHFGEPINTICDCEGGCGDHEAECTPECECRCFPDVDELTPDDYKLILAYIGRTKVQSSLVRIQFASAVTDEPTNLTLGRVICAALETGMDITLEGYGLRP